MNLTTTFPRASELKMNYTFFVDYEQGSKCKITNKVLQLTSFGNTVCVCGLPKAIYTDYICNNINAE